MAKLGIPKRLRYAAEGAAVTALFAGLRLLPLPVASWLCGAIAGLIGPLLPPHARARRHMMRAMPELSPRDVARALTEMWHNLGRVAGEYPHLTKFRAFSPGGRIEVVGEEHLAAAKEAGRGMFFTGHIGNWEVSGLPLIHSGIDIAFVYRAPNNPIVDRLIRRARGRGITENAIAKGASGAREMVRQVREGGYTAMLVDQKMNDGIAVPFFGRDAMTAPALAQLARKYNLPIWPVRTERIAGCRFRVTIYPELERPRSDDPAADVAETMRRINEIMEDWIRERPGQWLWPHNRWPKDGLPNPAAAPGAPDRGAARTN
jgi:KDO2-lipid IV(A) lauroyltransferase